MAAQITASILALLGAWFCISKFIVKDGWQKLIWLIVAIILFASWSGSYIVYEYIGLVGWIVSVVMTVLLGWQMSHGTKSGAKLYLAEARGALRHGKTQEDAILAGLRLLVSRKPFNNLAEHDLLFLAEFFAKTNKPELLVPFIVEADKNNSVDRLKSREGISKYIFSIIRPSRS